MAVVSDAPRDSWVALTFKAPTFFPEGRHSSGDRFGGEPFCGYFNRGEVAYFPPLLAARLVADGRADYV